MIEHTSESDENQLASTAHFAQARRNWVLIVLAAVAMVATLPGRTFGLGLITEELLDSLQLDRLSYGLMNTWATLIGATFCLPCGWLVDRLGVRSTMTTVLIGLGLTVYTMSLLERQASGLILLPTALFLLLLLTRGLGQSALSVFSLTLMGQVAGKRGGIAVGCYSVLVSLGFMAAFGLSRYLLHDLNMSWREYWGRLGLVLIFVVAPATYVLAPRPCQAKKEERSSDGTTGHSLVQALLSRPFWIFAGATSLYGLISAGIALFNESILHERGFPRVIFLNISIASPLVGLAGNLGAGLLAERVGLPRLLVLAMLFLALALFGFPYVSTISEIYLYAAVVGLVGGMITAIFFGVWVRLYGVRELGRIQGAAQMLTVLASAIGPLLFAYSFSIDASYLPLMRILAFVSLVFALAACTLKNKGD